MATKQKALSKEAREFFVSEGRKGGRASWKGYSKTERSDRARSAVAARWARWRRDNGKPLKPGDKELLEGTE